MSKSIRGPWITPVDDAFDGRAYYAGRTAQTGGRRILFGWIPTKENDSDLGNFQWGGTFMPHEIVQRGDSSLGVKIPDTVWAAFNREERKGDLDIHAASSCKEEVIEKASGDLFRLEANIVFSEHTHAFAVKLYENSGTGEGYQFKFLPDERRVVFETTPNQPWYRNMNIGIERPLSLRAGETCQIRVIVDGTITTLYAGDVALNARMYSRPGECVAFSLVDGRLTVSDISLAKGLKDKRTPEN
jgi:beta-fructofuranosidase